MFACCQPLLILLSTQLQSHAVVVDQCATSLCSSHQQRQQYSRYAHVHCARYISDVQLCACASSVIPAVDVDDENQVVHECVSNGDLDSGNHGAFLLALCVFFPWSTILLDHTYQLNIATHDCRYSSQEASAK